MRWNEGCHQAPLFQCQLRYLQVQPLAIGQAARFSSGEHAAFLHSISVSGIGEQTSLLGRNRPLFPEMCPLFPCAPMRQLAQHRQEKSPKRLICLGLLRLHDTS